VESLIVPSSIQRIRSFLIEMCGMKVKPWAGSEETLAALHATLVARNGCDIFWTSLRVLLETLARDLKTRQDAGPGVLVDNEVLDGERYAGLIDEIRAALAGQAAETPTSTFRRLAASLSTPALGLLLLLGGTTTIGCAREPLKSSSHDAAALGLTDVGSSQPETKADSSIRIVLDTRPVPLPDAMTTPDTAPAKYAATSGPDGGPVTIQDILDSCNIPAEQQGKVLGCLAALDSSWSAGMAAALTGQNCSTVANALVCNSDEVCAAEYGRPAFDPAHPYFCQPAPIPVYIGVRFV
jgi:hypothetical protein